MRELAPTGTMSGVPHEVERSETTPLRQALRVRIRKLWRRSRKFVRSLRPRRHHIFVHPGPFPPETRPDCIFSRYERFSDVPDDVRTAILQHQKERALAKDEREMQDGSVLWVARVEGMVAGVRHSRRATFFKKWFVPLEPSDIVVFRGRTFKEFRGRGIAPSMIRHILNHELSGGGKAHIDCSIHNKPSMRSISKAGFKRIGTKRTIKRDEAIGQVVSIEKAESQP